MNEKEFNDLFQQLTQELVRVEMQRGHIIIDQQRGELWWPGPWLVTMSSDKWLDKYHIDPSIRQAVSMCKPLDENNLSPMSDELRRLATACGLPHYEGRGGKEKLPPTPEQIKAALKEAKDAHPKKRCPKCGSKMKHAEVIAWEHYSRDPLLFPTPDECSSPLECKDCGHKDLQ